MATVQVNGNAVTATSTANNGGVMKANGGNVAGSPMSTNSTANPDLGVFASTVVSGVNTDAALSGGVFAHNHIKPLAFLVTEELGGLASTALQSPADNNELVRNPAPWEVMRTRRLTTAIRAGKFNSYTGVFDSGYPVTEVDLWWDVAADIGVTGVPDTAATPTQDVPGYLTYLYGAPNPSGDQYKERTLW
jgi:hypothetical protein